MHSSAMCPKQRNMCSLNNNFWADKMQNLWKWVENGSDDKTRQDDDNDDEESK